MIKNKFSGKDTEPFYAFVPEVNTSSIKKQKKYIIDYDPDHVQDIGSTIRSVAEVFELMFSDSRYTTLAAYLGYPDFPDSNTLNQEELCKALRSCLFLLQKNHIKFRTGNQYPEREIYNFIREELMEEEIVVPPTQSKELLYIYEEFFKKEIKFSTEAVLDFFSSLFSEDWRFINHCLGNEFIAEGYWYCQKNRKDFHFKIKNEFSGWNFNNCSFKLTSITRKNVTFHGEIILIQEALANYKILKNIRIKTEVQQAQFRITEITGLLKSDPLYL